MHLFLEKAMINAHAATVFKVLLLRPFEMFCFSFSGIVFLNFDAKDGSFPKKAEYKLRLNPDYTPSTQYVRAK